MKVVNKMVLKRRWLKKRVVQRKGGSKQKMRWFEKGGSPKGVQNKVIPKRWLQKSGSKTWRFQSSGSKKVVPKSGSEKGFRKGQKKCSNKSGNRNVVQKRWFQKKVVQRKNKPVQQKKWCKKSGKNVKQVEKKVVQQMVV